jgi:hypothetical protein
MIVPAAPALPLHAAGKYVAGAYIVFVVLLLVYLSIMAIRLQRTERELVELRRELDERRRPPVEPGTEPEPAQDPEPISR